MKKVVNVVIVLIIMMVVFPLLMLPILAADVTLDEANLKSGVYIKQGDRFTLIERQQIEVLYDGLRSGTDYNVLLVDTAVQIQAIPNNAQLVLIGLNRVYAQRIARNGYTIINIQYNYTYTRRIIK